MSELIQGSAHTNVQLVIDVSHDLTNFGDTFLPTLGNDVTNAQFVIEDSIERSF
jgi:hypothetical protein